MKMKRKHNLFFLLGMITITFVVLLIFSLKNNPNDVVTYEGKKYVSLNYNEDIFYYDFNNSKGIYFEEDIISPIESTLWDIFYLNGDLFVQKNLPKEANEYYSCDENYDWYVIIEENETETTHSITLQDEERSYLYHMEDKEKVSSLFWDEIEAFATLGKVSKDGIINAQIQLAYFENSWYWRTEIIDEQKEEHGTWPEYIQPLPESLSKKIEAYKN